MVKGKVTIPKTEQACKDGKCGHPHEIPFDIEDPKPETMSPPIVTLEGGSQVTQLIQQTPPIHQHEEQKKLSHEEITELMPYGRNYMSCPGGDCGHKKLKNDNQVLKYKTCPNGRCEDNTITKKDEFCPTCGKDIDDFGELDEGVELADIEEDDD